MTIDKIRYSKFEGYLFEFDRRGIIDTFDIKIEQFP